MNIKNEKSPDELLALKILEEISEDSGVSQRALSERLGVALGLVNTYIKHLVKKGYIRASQFPRARYKYLLTPQGIAEKSRLVYKHLSYYNNLFKTVRNDSLNLFKNLEKRGIKEISFCGIDEVAEISYLSLKETNIKLIDVFDVSSDVNCLDYKVKNIKEIKNLSERHIYISSLKKKREIYGILIDMGIAQSNISYLGSLDD